MRLRDLPDATPDATGTATVASISADGSVTVDLGGGQVVPALVTDTYAPVRGDSVAVTRLTPTSYWVLGRRRTTNALTQTLVSSWPTPYTVLPAVTGVANPLIVNAVETKSWRKSDGWSRDQVYQGRYSTAEDYWYGCGFHANGVAPILGRTCTFIRLRVHRANSGGVISGQAQYIAPHAHKTRPSGAPVFTAAAQRITSALDTAGNPVNGDLDRDQTKRLILPTSWGQDLLDGRIGGFGHLLLATGNGNYSIDWALADDAAQWQLEIGWA